MNPASVTDLRLPYAGGINHATGNAEFNGYQYIAEARNIYGLCLQKIILFGSYARGDYHAESDVDLMILFGYISDTELKTYSQKLSYMTYDFNLDNDIDIKPIAKSGHILTNGRKLPVLCKYPERGVILYGKS